MSQIDPVWAGVAELSRAFGARTLSPVDAVDALLERIRRRNPSLHAFIAVYEDDARLVAEGADPSDPRRAPVGPLHGVPIALKDLVDLGGRITTGGSKVWAERVFLGVPRWVLVPQLPMANSTVCVLPSTIIPGGDEPLASVAGRGHALGPLPSSRRW